MNNSNRFIRNYALPWDYSVHYGWLMTTVFFIEESIAHKFKIQQLKRTKDADQLRQYTKEEMLCVISDICNNKDCIVPIKDRVLTPIDMVNIKSGTGNSSVDELCWKVLPNVIDEGEGDLTDDGYFMTSARALGWILYRLRGYPSESIQWMYNYHDLCLLLFLDGNPVAGLKQLQS